MKQILITIMGIAMVSVMAGCAERAIEKVTEKPTSVPSPAPSATNLPTDTTSSETLIEYRRSGGFAGFDDHLLISSEGKAILTQKSGRQEFTLTPESFALILRQLDQIEFSQLKTEYLPANTCCDLIEYVVTYKGHTVRTMDTAVPPLLQPILEALNKIIQTQVRP